MKSCIGVLEKKVFKFAFLLKEATPSGLQNPK